MPFFRRWLDQGLDHFQRHAVLGMSLVLLLSLSGLAWHMQQLFTQQLHNTALKNAQLYTAVLTEIRSLYTSEVVSRAMLHGMTITHDYESNPQAIPLPATMSMLLGSRLGSQNRELRTRLYSPYPFPWRKQEGGLRDSFGEQAWQALQANPEQPFYRFEEQDGKLTLRYATADDFGLPETAFNVCTFWLIEALHFTGRDADARQLFDEMLQRRTAAGLLSEDIDPVTGELWGNYPQTYSLVGMINCAVLLSKPWSSIR